MDDKERDFITHYHDYAYPPYLEIEIGNLSNAVLHKNVIIKVLIIINSINVTRFRKYFSAYQTYFHIKLLKLNEYSVVLSVPSRFDTRAQYTTNIQMLKDRTA